MTMNIRFQGRRLFSNTFILMVSCTIASETMCIFSTMVFPGRLIPPESLVGGSAMWTKGVQFCKDGDETCLGCNTVGSRRTHGEATRIRRTMVINGFNGWFQAVMLVYWASYSDFVAYSPMESSHSYSATSMFDDPPANFWGIVD